MKQTDSGVATTVVDSYRGRLFGPMVSLLRGSLWTLLAQAVSRLLVLVILVAAARQLDVENFGMFVSLQALGLLTAALWDIGFSPMITREVAAQNGSFSSLYRSALITRLWLFPVALGVYVLGCLILRVEIGHQTAAAALIFIGSLANSLWLLHDAGLKAEQRFRATSLALVTGRLFALAVSIFAASVFSNYAMEMFAVGFLSGEFLSLFILSKLPKSATPETRIFNKSNGAIRDFRTAAPYALNGLFSMIYGRMDVVLVAMFAGSYQSGIFAPGSRAQDALSLLPATASAAVVPIAAKRFGESQDSGTLIRTGITALVLSLGLTLPVLVIVYIAAGSIVTTLLGNEFSASIYVVRVSIWSLVFVAIAQPIFSIIVAAGRAASLNWAYGIGLVVALIGHAVLDPMFGARGAAWVSVVRDGIACLVGCVVAFKWLVRQPSNTIESKLSQVGVNS